MVVVGWCFVDVDVRVNVIVYAMLVMAAAVAEVEVVRLESLMVLPVFSRTSYLHDAAAVAHARGSQSSALPHLCGFHTPAQVK